MRLAVAIVFGQEKHELLASEVRLFEARFGAVKILDRVALLEPALERLEHFAVDLPVFITANTAGYFSLLNTNVRDDGNGFVVAAEVTERRPIVIVLGESAGCQDWQKHQTSQLSFPGKAPKCFHELC